MRMNQLIDQARAAESNGERDRALELYEEAFRQQTRAGHGAGIADLLRWMSTIRRDQGDLVVAEELAEASLAVALARAEAPAAAAAENCLGIIAQFRGRLADAEACYWRARAGAEACGERRLEAMIEQNLGIIANIRGDVEGALMRYQAALQVYRQLDDAHMMLRCLNNAGMAHVDRGDWTAASLAFEEAFAMAEQLRDTTMLGNIALNRTELYFKCGDYERARECCDIGFEISSQLGLRSGEAEAHKYFGVLYRHTSKPRLAGFHLKTAAQLARDAEDRLLEAEIEYEHALLLLDVGDNQEALQRLTTAHRLFTEMQASPDASNVDGRLDELEHTFLAVMQRWGESIESKDVYTAGHCQRVADYACLLAEDQGITGRELTWFRMGAFLHDVGKIEVPEQILNKPGGLTPEEWALMQRHTIAGDEIVARLEFPWNIRPIVRSHHEQWCGNGYPDALAGEEIPLHARILCIADIYDALTTARSYRPALPRDEALRIMERDAGRVLDPQLFVRFRALVERRPEPIRLARKQAAAVRQDVQKQHSGQQSLRTP
jgi:putative nucleotidyltransferase with HDIG domain